MEGINKTVLLLDDEQAILDALARLLRSAGYQVIQALRGEDALTLISQNEVALIICDQKMPGLSGATVLKKVKELSEDTIRIMLTGSADISMFLDSINEAHVSQLLLKPWDNEHLLMVVAESVRQYNLFVENRRLENALKFTQFAVDHASDAAFWLEASGHVFYANKSACGLSGYSADDLVGIDFFSLFPESDKQEWRDKWDKCREKGCGSFESLILTQEGSGIPVEINNDFVEFQEKSYTCVFIRDISDKIKNRELREDIERITRHDLKSPLNAVIGVPALIKLDSNLTEDQRHLLDSIEESGRRMLDMINLNLDLYKMEKGLYHYQPTVIPFFALLKRIMFDMSNLLKIMKLRVVYIVNGIEVLCKGNFSIQGEELLCFSMFCNLIKNAIEASPEGDTLTITMDDQTDDMFKIISIHNKGCVPEEVRETFFEKFVTSGKSHGTGLGTYSARLIAETQKGGISMQSSESSGTVVTIKLPKEYNLEQ